MAVGQLREFDLKDGNWSAYCDRMEMYFLANKVDETVKLATLISVMGEETYELLSTLSSPVKPSQLKYTDAITLLKNHLQPTPSILAERYRFRQRRQQDGESIAEYVAELKKMAKYCDFKTSLEENLRDQLVCGIKSETTRQRLFAEDDALTYTKAVKLAITLEAAERDASAVEQPRAPIGLNSVQLATKCMACGDSRHRTENCKYRNFDCSRCQKIGHLRRMCPDSYGANERRGNTAGFSGHMSRGASATGSSRGRGRGRGRGRRGGYGGYSRGVSAYWMQGPPADEGHRGQSAPALPQADTEDDYDDVEEEEPMYQMSLTNYKPT